jgi:AcrR family transcriptional regulator
MLDSAVVLLRERGAGRVSVDAVLAHSGAPRGSVYHHFPGGRKELITGAVRRAGDYIVHAIDRAAESGDPQQVLDMFVRFWTRTLRESDFRAGCPVLAVAIDGDEDVPEAAALVREIFAAWHDRLTRLLAGNGVDDERARRLATLTVAAIEGAIALCRAQKSETPLQDVAAELRPLLAI